MIYHYLAELCAGELSCGRHIQYHLAREDICCNGRPVSLFTGTEAQKHKLLLLRQADRYSPE